MRQLDTCDFCGDAAEGVYEVVPASVAGEPKRLALCADCRTTLQSVVDPLLNAANATDSTDSTDDDASTDVAARDSAAADTASTGDDPAAESDSTATSADAEGVTIEVGGPDDEDDASEDASAERGDSAEDAAAGGSPARRPSGYAQLIRLLQNRDGAMPREDLRALATNAYDLGSTEFDDALEAAIENGDVEESGGGLRTT